MTGKYYLEMYMCMQGNLKLINILKVDYLNACNIMFMVKYWRGNRFGESQLTCQYLANLPNFCFYTSTQVVL